MDVNCLHDFTLFVMDIHQIMLISDTILPLSLSPNFYLKKLWQGRHGNGCETSLPDMSRTQWTGLKREHFSKRKYGNGSPEARAVQYEVIMTRNLPFLQSWKASPLVKNELFTFWWTTRKAAMATFWHFHPDQSYDVTFSDFHQSHDCHNLPSKSLLHMSQRIRVSRRANSILKVLHLWLECLCSAEKALDKW